MNKTLNLGWQRVNIQNGNSVVIIDIILAFNT